MNCRSGLGFAALSGISAKHFFLQENTRTRFRRYACY